MLTIQLHIRPYYNCTLDRIKYLQKTLVSTVYMSNIFDFSYLTSITTYSSSCAQEHSPYFCKLRTAFSCQLSNLEYLSVLCTYLFYFTFSSDNDKQDFLAPNTYIDKSPFNYSTTTSRQITYIC